MKKLGIIFALLLVAGFGMFLQRQNLQDTRNSRAIERITSGDRFRPGTRPRPDALQRERVRQSPAGARHNNATK